MKMWHSDTLAVPDGGHGMSLQRFLFKPPSLLFSLPMSWVRLCTGVLLPPCIATQYGLKQGIVQRLVFCVTFGLLRFIYKLLPGSFRYLSPYLQAEQV
jgi:hypothetical protein